MHPYSIQTIDYTLSVRQYVSGHHYTGSSPLLAEHVFGLFEGERLLGVAIFGFPTRAQSQRLHPNDLELTRFYVEDGTPKNTESYFLGGALRQLKKIEHRVGGVLSYADKTEGHTGTIYKASNFQLLGETAPSYHYVDGEGKRRHKKGVWEAARRAKTSEAEYAAFLGLKKVPELPKLKFRYKLKDLPADYVFGWVYKITNTITNKVYIGQTIRLVESRYKRHIYDAKGGSVLPIHEAMRRYGVQNFRCEKLCSAANRIELNKLEAEQIVKFDSLVGARGYNLNFHDFDGWTVADSIVVNILDLVSKRTSYREICERLGVSRTFIHESIKGIRRPELLGSWEKLHGPIQPDIRLKISNDDLLRCFELRSLQGLTVKEVAERFGVNTEWLSCVFTGYYRPEVLKAWKAKGGGGFEQIVQRNLRQTASKTRALSSSDGLHFSGLPTAAAHYGVSTQAIYKCIKFEKPLAGVTFQYTEGPKRLEAGKARKQQAYRIEETQEVFPSAVAVAAHIGCHPNEPAKSIRLGRKIFGKWTLVRI